MKILLAYDGLSTSIDSVRWAARFAKLLDAEILVVHVITKDAINSVQKGGEVKDAQRHCISRTQGIFSLAQEILEKEGVSWKKRVIVAEDVASGIEKAGHVDVMILQPSPYKHAELAGDLSRRIAHSASTPSIFVKTNLAPRSKGCILVPIDENEDNLSVLDPALKIARGIKGSIIFYHTTWRAEGVKSPDPLEHCDASVRKDIRIAEERARLARVPFKTVVEMQETIEEGIILCAIRNEADLVVMARSTAIIGGKSELVLEHAMFPLMIIP